MRNKRIQVEVKKMAEFESGSKYEVAADIIVHTTMLRYFTLVHLRNNSSVRVGMLRICFES